MAMGCLAGCKKSLSWTDPLNHKKRADNFSARFLFSDSPQLYFPTTSLPELEPAAGNELPFPLSPPLSTHHSRLSGFPFLLLMTHPFVHSLPTKQNLKWSLKGVGIIHNDERVVEGSDLEKFTMMAFLQNAAKTNCDLGQFRWKSIWSRQTKVKDFLGEEEMEKNVEMKSYLRLSHSPPGSLSNTFWRQWEREMTNVRSRERGKTVEKIIFENKMMKLYILYQTTILPKGWISSTSNLLLPKTLRRLMRKYLWFFFFVGGRDVACGCSTLCCDPLLWSFFFVGGRDVGAPLPKDGEHWMSHCW